MKDAKKACQDAMLYLEIYISVGAMPVHTGHHDVALEIPGHRHHHCYVIVAVSCSNLI